MSKIKVGIIGVGHLGSRHLKVYNEIKNTVDLVGICDVREEIALPLAREYNVPFFKDYHQLTGKIDAVNICVPTSLHHEVASFFLRQRVHTFIEKPIATSVDQAEDLIALANQARVKLQVGHVERFNAAFEAVKPLAQNPLFIECHRLNLFPNRSLDIGVVMDLMIHDIDIILGLNQSPVQNIEAIGVNVLTKLEDIASVRMNFANGCVCNLTASRISDEVMRKIRIFQRDKYISLDYVKQEAFVYTKENGTISKKSLPIEKQEPLRKELEHFIDCIREDKTPLISGKEGKDALEVALRICEKIWNGNKS